MEAPQFKWCRFCGHEYTLGDSIFDHMYKRHSSMLFTQWFYLSLPRDKIEELHHKFAIFDNEEITEKDRMIWSILR